MAARATTRTLVGITPAGSDLVEAADPAAQLTALGAAPLASPAFTGSPTAPTPAANDNDTSVATTAFVTAALTTYAGTVTTALAGKQTASAELNLWAASASTAYGRSITTLADLSAVKSAFQIPPLASPSFTVSLAVTGGTGAAPLVSLVGADTTGAGVRRRVENTATTGQPLIVDEFVLVTGTRSWLYCDLTNGSFALTPGILARTLAGDDFGVNVGTTRVFTTEYDGSTYSYAKLGTSTDADVPNGAARSSRAGGKGVIDYGAYAGDGVFQPSLTFYGSTVNTTPPTALGRGRWVQEDGDVALSADSYALSWPQKTVVHFTTSGGPKVLSGIVASSITPAAGTFLGTGYNAGPDAITIKSEDTTNVTTAADRITTPGGADIVVAVGSYFTVGRRSTDTRTRAA